MKLDFVFPMAFALRSTLGLTRSFSMSAPADRVREQLEALADRLVAAMAVHFRQPTNNQNQR